MRWDCCVEFDVDVDDEDDEEREREGLCEIEECSVPISKIFSKNKNLLGATRYERDCKSQSTPFLVIGE